MSDELPEDSSAPEQSRKGRPKGSKNKPKRGRPRKKASERKAEARLKAGDKVLPTIKKIIPKDPLVIPDTIDATPIPESIAPDKTQDELLDSYLDEALLNEQGLNKEINQDPVDPSWFYRGSKTIPVAGAQYAFTADMVEELRKCKEDILYFAENFFHIVTIDRGKQKIQLYAAQKRVLRSLADNRFVSLLSSRQTGKSTLLTIFVLWMVCFKPDYRAAIVANKESTAINIFKRIRMAYEQLPNYIKPGVKDYAKTGMTLENDSSVIVSTTTATSIRGDTLNCLAIDEAAFIEPHILEEFWNSVIPSVSSGKTSKILMVSTPNGVGNKFYEIYSGAERGLNGWIAERIDWQDVPGRDEAWKQSMISALGGSEEKFLQEFGNVFLDGNTGAVGAHIIERFKREKKPPIWTSEDGEYTVFEYPDKNKLYVVGVDVGEGIGRAASVAQILDVTDLQHIKQVAVYGSNTIEPYHFANKLSTIGCSWGLPPMLIERNNCGAQVIDALHYKHSYEKIISYAKISESDKYNRTRNMGVLSHTNIRFDGVQNLRYWVNHLQCVEVNDPTTISEFETFVRQANGIYRKRGEAFFDDRIMALVWALFILEPEICQQYFTIEDYDTQHKPLKIVSNGYWETVPNTFELKALGKTPTVIPNNSLPKDLAYRSLDVSYDELNELDKYDLDYQSLLDMGFEPL